MAFHIKQFRESYIGLAQYTMMVNARQFHEEGEKSRLGVNSLLTDTAWVDIDKNISELRSTVKGIEIVDYLDSVVRPTDLGKYALEYTMSGDIDDSVAVDLNGSTPITYDNIGLESDGDPIPFFRAGFGVDFRPNASMKSIGFDWIGGSERAKIRKFHERIVDYTLNGSDNIRIGGYAGEGLLNHRNTYKIDLAGATSTYDLTTATPAQLESFFQNVFSKVIDDNELMAVDKIFVSPEIYSNLTKSWAIAVEGDGQGSVLDRLRPYMSLNGGNDAIQKTYALSGNEFLAIKRDRDYVEKPVGQGMIVLPLPRDHQFRPQNFEIIGAQGISVKRDALGRSGVIYAGENT